ncbi:MAG: hypothetical protein IJ468_07415 [Lachnospiraceae bacterium]|nr:hypothetical protein [Lachnospiraceae bacterium]
MVDLKDLQRKVYQNKVDHKFNVTNIEFEFCLAYGEMAEAYQAYLKKKDDLGEELADVAIYLLGLAEILGIDLEQEILQKMEKNRKRIYREVNGEMIKVEGE